MIGIRSIRSIDVLTKSAVKHSDVVTVTDSSTIKEQIGNLLFGCNYNSVLVNYNNELFVCQTAGDSYVKRRVNYHPLQESVTAN